MKNVPCSPRYYDTPALAGRHPVFSAWVVHGDVAGLCVREDNVATTNNDSCFVPHVVAPPVAPVVVRGARKVLFGLVWFSFALLCFASLSAERATARWWCPALSSGCARYMAVARRLHGGYSSGCARSSLRTPQTAVRVTLARGAADATWRVASRATAATGATGRG